MRGRNAWERKHAEDWPSRFGLDLEGGFAGEDLGGDPIAPVQAEIAGVRFGELVLDDLLGVGERNASGLGVDLLLGQGEQSGGLSVAGRGGGRGLGGQGGSLWKMCLTVLGEAFSDGIGGKLGPPDGGGQVYTRDGGKERGLGEKLRRGRIGDSGKAAD